MIQNGRHVGGIVVHPRVAAAGADARGRMIEMVGVELEGGGVLIYHAMRLTAKMARELRLGS